MRRYWGYDSFLQRQEEIVRSILSGHDLAAILPTGGGKSSCYQLPALVLGRTAIVISPLIALMQDQAFQLGQMGIPAAVLNSALTWQEQNEVMRNAAGGAYRLLYLSPERLSRPETITWLTRVPIAFFAIDEAHCISEWGHEFRPEYRQLSCLRENFPDRPIAAFTASATRRVRHDILEQLKLREPDKFIRSFVRPNLRYVVRQCDIRTQRKLLLSALRSYEGASVIVYAPTIAGVEETVDYLGDHGITAIPYHGKMDAADRQRNQERWTSDETRVLVGTIAFGLGINKPAVRAVIHLSMPKSIEQYYQESGRAGRDGLPADCALLWQARDTALLAYFIDKLQDAAEKDRSWARYRSVKRFIESADCRKQQICIYFGENPKWQRCEQCDACGSVPDWFLEPDAEEAPRKRRKRVRIPERTPVVMAAGAPKPRPAVAQPPAAPLVDRGLLDYLREWRRKLAQRNGVPAFLVLADTSLEDLCRKRPLTLRELMQVTGIGERKAEQYGDQIFAALEAYARGERAAAPAENASRPAEETIALLDEGKTFDEIARIRNRQRATVVSLVANLVEQGRIECDARWVDPAHRLAIEDAAREAGLQRLRVIKDACPPEVTYEEVHLVVAGLRRTSGQSRP